MSLPHTDIVRLSWIERLPPRFRPYFYLARIDRPIGIWLLLLPGWWGIALAAGGFGGFDAGVFALAALFALGAVVMRAAGCVVNDLWDRDLDRKVERTKTRPLASGALGAREALLFLGALLTIGFAILVQMPMLTIVLGVASLPLIALYPLMKRVTWWPQLFLGVTFNFGAPMGWSAQTGTLAPAAFLLYAGGIFWTLAYDTIYAHQDIEDDALAGIRSTARLFGARSKAFVVIFYALSALCLSGAGIASGAGAFYFFGVAAALGHALWSAGKWNQEYPAESLSAFRASRIFGFLVLGGAIFYGP